jgi:hypothetical protein
VGTLVWGCELSRAWLLLLPHSHPHPHPVSIQLPLGCDPVSISRFTSPWAWTAMEGFSTLYGDSGTHGGGLSVPSLIMAQMHRHWVQGVPWD